MSLVAFFLFLTRPGITIYHFDISWALPRRVTQLSALVPLSPGKNRQPQLGLHCLEEPPRGSHLCALFSLRLSGSPLPHHPSWQLSLLPHRGNSSPRRRRLIIPRPRTLPPLSLSRPCTCFSGCDLMVPSQQSRSPSRNASWHWDRTLDIP